MVARNRPAAHGRAGVDPGRPIDNVNIHIDMLTFTSQKIHTVNVNIIRGILVTMSLIGLIEI